MLTNPYKNFENLDKFGSWVFDKMRTHEPLQDKILRRAAFT